jgi:hypothetical protein
VAKFTGTDFYTLPGRRSATDVFSAEQIQALGSIAEAVLLKLKAHPTL